MTPAYLEHLNSLLADIAAAGLTREERVLTTPQHGRVHLAEVGGSVLNFCSNNYLGLAGHPEILTSAHTALDRWGYGLASVRFICGTQEIHRDLEKRLSAFLGTEDTILYSSCFDANGGVFETLLGPEDAVISDELNHASIIDGIRLCKAKRYRYRNRHLGELEDRLREANVAGARHKLIVTDGVFSMDGFIAPLRALCDLAERHHALVMVDDSHATGVLGPNGRGTPELCGVTARVDLITSTLGKALGGASGGYVSGRKEIIALLRQRSRPYLFSNSLAPMIAATSLTAIALIERSSALRKHLREGSAFVREGLSQVGLTVLPGIHPIIPVMLGEAARAQFYAARLLTKGVHVAAFAYPVVPLDAARIRVQVSAAHTWDDLKQLVRAFAEVHRESP